MARESRRWAQQTGRLEHSDGIYREGTQTHSAEPRRLINTIAHGVGEAALYLSDNSPIGMMQVNNIFPPGRMTLQTLVQSPHFPRELARAS